MKLNTQRTSELENGRPQDYSVETQPKEGNNLSRKTDERMERDLTRYGWRRSHIWFIAEYNPPDNNNFPGTQRNFNEERQGNIEEPVNAHVEEMRGHFNSKFNNRKPLSLHPPVTMATDTSPMLRKLKQTVPEETEKIVRSLQKIRFQREKKGTERLFPHRQVPKTIGEKSIKLARDNNTLPEVLSRRRSREEEDKRHYLPRLDLQVLSAPSSRFSINLDKASSCGRAGEGDELASRKSILAWSACVVPATLVDFPGRKRLPLMTSLRKSRKRVKDSSVDAVSKPLSYREHSAQLLPRSSMDKPLSSTRLLYPSHHGY
ncbi:uncharacterized protein LOC111322046 [Stylophora pistillata]|uniref:uncharacterized protein LOC111322046 n=1 Tax=Stylophora pistillata TaxID=50429 RepID=UPI000C041BA1|nr:uncharacterized protein LOC111322046 [Stylophora pistillata]